MEGDHDERRVGNKRGRDDENKGHGEGRLEKKPSGMMVNVIEEYSYSYSGDEMINGVKYEEEKETQTPTPTSTSTTAGGLFNQLITNLVNSPASNQLDAEHREGENAVSSDGDGKSNGNDNGGEVAEKVKEEDGNIIDNIVARLPRTLSEDTAPATDEASILIHSIIHD